MIEWPEIINTTWSEYEHWMRNDRKNQIQFITKIPGIINTFLILFFTALDVVGPNFMKRFHLQEKKAFPERSKNVFLIFYMLTPTLAGCINEDYSPWNGFCRKLYCWINRIFFRFYPEFHFYVYYWNQNFWKNVFRLRIHKIYKFLLWI